MRSQQARLRELNLALLVCFALVAVSLVYWVAIRSDGLAAREDNPRAVEQALRVRRGRILDSDGVVLAETVGPTDALRRIYPIVSIGPAVGYYSFRYGTVGVERSLDSELRGETDTWRILIGRELLHLPQTGRDVRLTLNAAWQEMATALLSGHQGAALLLSISDGAVRVMASQPGYDPNLLDASFPELSQDEEGALLNRATQGQYQPGLALAPFAVAALVEAGKVELGDPAQDVGVPARVDDATWQCTGEPPESATFADAVRLDCPGPLLALADALTLAEWGAAFMQMGLTVPPELPLAVAEVNPVQPSVAANAVLGQDTLVVSPLQLALTWMALFKEGVQIQPRLVNAVTNEAGEWQTYTRVSPERQALEAGVAGAISAALAREANVIEHAAPALSGPGGESLMWYLGAAPAGAPQFVVVVIVENSDDVDAARSVGRALLSQAVVGAR